ncbi:MAG: MurR/RpiR family transcriptional regulator [Pseudomonadota bacterium]
MSHSKLNDLTPGKLQSLSPQLRKAARYVVEHPGEIATRSQRFVADDANLSAPTFTRLARAIGYDSYDDLRETCRVEVLHNRTVLAEKAQMLVDADTANEGFTTRHAAAAIRNTEALIARLDPAEVDAAAQLLASARHVALLGVMSAGPIVDYAMYLANMSLTGWTVPGRGGHGLASDLADLGSDDVGIVFSIAPYAAQAVDLADQVTRTRVPLIALTDNHLAPIAEHARHCFCIGTESPQFFPSHVAAMVFFEAIIGMVIQMKGKEAQQRIAAVERQNHELGQYWQDNSASNKGA